LEKITDGFTHTAELFIGLIQETVGEVFDDSKPARRQSPAIPAALDYRAVPWRRKTHPYQCVTSRETSPGNFTKAVR